MERDRRVASIEALNNSDTALKKAKDDLKEMEKAKNSTESGLAGA